MFQIFSSLKLFIQQLVFFLLNVIYLLAIDAIYTRFFWLLV